jgi:hypothetical protein
MSFVNPFSRSGRWHKANFHSHTTTSDGDASIAHRVRQYAKAGYSVLAITDHRQTNDVTGLTSKELLVISGMEYHPRCSTRGGGYHLVALDVPHGFGFAEEYPPDANSCIQAVKKAGGHTILGHPFWCGLRHDQIACLKDIIALEVFNSQCDRVGRGESNEAWSNLLDSGRALPVVAVDDTHDAPDLFFGWTMLKLRQLSVPAVIEAVQTGCSYSSSGPVVLDFAVRRRHVEIECSPAVAIYLLAQDAHGDRALPRQGKTIRCYRRQVHKNWNYVRAVVVDAGGRKAWTNPIYLK